MENNEKELRLELIKIVTEQNRRLNIRATLTDIIREATRIEAYLIKGYEDDLLDDLSLENSTNIVKQNAK